ncbi:CaiB/BaiF CoA transferase family protein [Hyphomonas sp.]|uniref:CaiB/BaiF CoA transferase family protein n=1 Tax=Hyphomonas sp. TaxID=87 RepID=UPI00391957D8
MKLEGLKVLDLSAFLPGPHMTMMMADHGADVIMVEPANGVGEPVREIGERTPDGTTVWFRNIARGKRSLKLNLKDPAGVELLLKLAETADVFVEAFRPGVVKRLGVDFAAVAARNPRIVYCSISAFGQTGQHVQKPAHDLVVQAMTGLMDLGRGLTDNQPAPPPVPFADSAASLMALSAILMALYRREKTGAGDYIDMSMYDAAIAWTPNVLGPTFGKGEAPEPKKMRSFGGAAMNSIYPTSDGGFVVIGGSEVKFAENLLSALGRPDLLDYAKIPPGDGQEPLKAFFRETFSANTLAYWTEFLQPVDCCWAPVRSLKDAFDDPFTAERGMVFSDASGNRHVGPPIRFMNEPPRPNPALPAFGEHSEAIAAEAGLSPDTIRKLKEKGTI